MTTPTCTAGPLPFTTPPPSTAPPRWAPGDRVVYVGSLGEYLRRRGTVVSMCRCSRCPGDGDRLIVDLHPTPDEPSKVLFHCRAASLQAPG